MANLSSSNFDLTLQAGDDHDLVVTWLPDGDIADLDGASAEMRVSWVKGILSDGTVVAEGSVDVPSGDITFDVETGAVTVHLSAAISGQIPSIHSVYQLRVTTSDEVKTTIASGKLTAKRDLLDD